MKRRILAIFITKMVILFSVIGVLSFSNDKEPVLNDSPIIDKTIQGTNTQDLEKIDVEVKDVLLKNQDLESSNVEIANENLKNESNKIKVVQTNTGNLEEELSQGIEQESYLLYILGGLGILAIVLLAL